MNKRIFVFLVCLSSTVFSAPKTICGYTDDRVASFDSRIGRLSNVNKETGEISHKGCTVTLISDRCGITAGHCKVALDLAEFNTPLSNSEGVPQASSFSDLYKIKQDSIVHKYSVSSDWAVVEFEPNVITSKLPGEVYGHYDVDFSKVKKGTQISITGYGRDYDDLEKNFTQQTHTGKITSKGFWGMPFLYYNADTTGGNSGSSIINVETQKIIGVHTNGGCTNTGGENKGQYLNKISEFKEAIKNCLEKSFL